MCASMKFPSTHKFRNRLELVENEIQLYHAQMYMKKNIGFQSNLHILRNDKILIAFSHKYSSSRTKYPAKKRKFPAQLQRFRLEQKDRWISVYMTKLDSLPDFFSLHGISGAHHPHWKRF